MMAEFQQRCPQAWKELEEANESLIDEIEQNKKVAFNSFCAKVKLG